jgi:hypothetical protein
MLFRLQEEGGGSQRISSGKFLPGIQFQKDQDIAFLDLLADAEFPDDGFVTLGIVSLEVVEQATPLADQHEQAAARAVVLLVRFEVIRQLANAFTNDGDLNFGTPRVSRVRLILVNYGFLLLSG